MATKKEIKEILKELNLTESEMDKIWEELRLTNSVVNSLIKSGKTWRDLNDCVIRKIPTQKERDLENHEKNRIEKEDKEKAEKEEEEKRKYYDENFESIMIEKINSGEDLTEEELKTLVFEYGIEREYGENDRWDRHVSSIVKLLGITYCIDWRQGLTECQDDSFSNQPYKVKLITKTIEVKEYVKDED